MAIDQFIKQPARGPLVGVTFEQVNFSASGDNIIIPAIIGRKIRIHKLFIVGAGASNIRFWSGPSSEAVSLSGLMPFGSNFGLAFDGDEFVIETGLGKGFVINSSNAIQVGGWVSYTLY